ncbi:MOSC domain-containing protein YiiM [Streptomyces griseochromogenes]|uniref:MOSC domain-containing protein YiiM n=1 Tax=Streptomyces griseochromogenes TaxID=68214 RepID=A0ABS4M047_9ACTN|nr:MOSC domain-containing protein [Streptomyces griseochromogenes]MBP2053035.1 MOSC domain-containing protein YiiM [Streptomyces griseochromogenes]
MTGQARLLTVNLGVERTGPWTSNGRSGIDKRPVPGPVWARATGLDGDLIVNTKAHGGVDKAVYAFAREDAVFWEKELGRTVGPGNFGENFSTVGIDITGAEIGEQWRIGEAVFEVIRPRKPCRVFAGFWDVPDLVKRFIAHGAPGAYLRVLTEGAVSPGEAIEVIKRPGHGITVNLMLRAITTERELLPRMLEAPEMLPKIQQKARDWIELQRRTHRVHEQGDPRATAAERVEEIA